jgi:hypothetical protein
VRATGHQGDLPLETAYLGMMTGVADLAAG